MKEIFLNRMDSDVALAFQRAAADLAPGTAATFRLDPGTYELMGSRYARRFCGISNHDSAERAVAFDFRGLADIVFDGGGAHFECVGRVIPFFLEGCRSITLRNFSLDWRRSFFTEGRIVEVRGPEEVVLAVDREKYPLRVANGRMELLGADYLSRDLENAIEVDAALMEIAAHAKDSWGIRQSHSAIEQENGTIIFKAPFGSVAQVGNIMVLPHELRTSPAIVAHRCSGMALEDITLYGAGGMGVIAQMCKDVKVERMVAKPHPARGSYMSLNADATHFVECEGDIVVRGCDFSGQSDDASNAHGVYLPIHAALGPREMMIRVGHPQQAAVDYFLAGEKIATVDPASFAPLDVLTVESIERVDALNCIFRTREALPENLAGKVITTGERQISYIAEDNNFHHYRTDGLLLSAPGKYVVRRNRFAVPGQGVVVTCDCSAWFESGRVDNMVIEDNSFENCSYGQRPHPSAVRIAPNDSHGTDNSSVVHKNIVIRRNRFIGRTPFISHYRTEGLVVEDNTYLDEAGNETNTGLIEASGSHSG